MVWKYRITLGKIQKLRVQPYWVPFSAPKWIVDSSHSEAPNIWTEENSLSWEKLHKTTTFCGENLHGKKTPHTPEVEQFTPETWWLEDYFPFSEGNFSVAMLNCWGVICNIWKTQQTWKCLRTFCWTPHMVKNQSYKQIKKWFVAFGPCWTETTILVRFCKGNLLPQFILGQQFQRDLSPQQNIHNIESTAWKTPFFYTPRVYQRRFRAT